MSVSGGYVLQYAGGTRGSSYSICHLKKLVRSEAFGPYYVIHHVEYSLFLSYCNETWNFSRNFRKILSQISQESVQ